MRNTAHVIAAIILILLATVKAAAAVRDLPLLYLQSPVFPFLKVSSLYYVAIGLELVVAFVCLRWMGRNTADYCLFSFVAGVVWYRIALYATGDGGYGCACLGILTMLFKLTKAQESAISIATLFLLASCVVPGFASGWRRFRSSRGCAQGLICVSLLIPLTSVSETIEIRGHYNYQRFNAQTGVPYTNDVGGAVQSGKFEFLTLLRPEAWRISVTNLDDSALWTELVFTGSNFYTLCPNRQPFIFSKTDNPDAVFATVSSSPFYHSAVSDWAYSAIPWMTYGLEPRNLKADENGLVGMPLPWETSRRKPLAFGWHWELSPSPDGRFAESCQVIRDSRLDLGQKAELLREQMNYPENLKLKNIYLQSLDFRQSIPDGFKDTVYVCHEWSETNGWRLPVHAETIRYLPGYEHAYFRTKLQVNSIKVTTNGPSIFGDVNYTRVVEDYRYKRAGNSRIFPYAEYKLAIGEQWKGTNDPTLLQLAQHHLEHGPRYNHYDYSFKLISAWVVGAVLLLSPPLLIWIRKHKHKTKG